MRGRGSTLCREPSPGAARAEPMARDIDTRAVLRPSASHAHPPAAGRSHERLAGARCLAEHIPRREVRRAAGRRPPPLGRRHRGVLDEVEEFLTGVRHGPEPDRVLATVLFTDIVGSTESAARARRPRAGASSSRRHHALVREQLARFRGREIDTAGDGFLATFDGPARGVRCALRDPRRGARRSAWRSAPACTPASARSMGEKSAASPCTRGARRGARGRRRGARLPHREGSGRRLGDRRSLSAAPTR